MLCTYFKYSTTIHKNVFEDETVEDFSCTLKEQGA